MLTHTHTHTLCNVIFYAVAIEKATVFSVLSEWRYMKCSLSPKGQRMVGESLYF